MSTTSKLGTFGGLQVPSGRMAVENRRTPAAIASNVWYMVSEKWNDESFSPTTSVKLTKAIVTL